MKKLVFALFILICNTVKSQDYNIKTNHFIGTFHTSNTTIHGLSVGAFPNFNDKNRFVKTNGIRLEIPGVGILLPIANGTPVTNITNVDKPLNATCIEFDEIVNGLNLSGGTVGSIKFNGITLGLIGQYGILSNGLSSALVMNSMDKTNGIQISGLLNENIYTNGIQFSLSNTSVLINGIQFGAANYAYQKSNGLQTGLYNIANKSIGVQFGLWNEINKGNGVQIGVFNKSLNFKGIQLGLWNKNQKQSLPFINWSFKS